MNQTLTILTGAALMALVAGAAPAQDTAKKKLYCWQENGRKVCGDALPASAVNSARTEFSAKSGMATARVDRALTAEERAAAATQAETDRLAAMAAEAKARRDIAMAQSYATESDLRRAFQERIAVLDETVKASQLGVEGRRQSLISLLRKAGENELNGKPVGSGLSDNIRNQHAELLRQQNILAQQKIERAAIDEDLAAALERYNAMKAAEAARNAGG
ncbi:hypothetical protein [Lysobacter silvisoli]|uniref:DUF4124 domain-containing protein n=1 Tax=Lysobacter silvisoli TaxID=2293254 RepID=A0A371JYU5_9GAMM|nr:hypothetical protein [Lysobacter silvisoli]RDZ26804.1 hypothetical protein DX914_17710 [Lysobacter silvisoli]